jgi:drug/metabolite transporter (DMT)-like permease
VLGAVLALACSLTGGASDFLAGTNSRRIGTLQWMFATQMVGVVLAGAWVAISGDPLPPFATLADATAAGFGLMVGLLAFFQAMVVGTISIVAPISATGVVIPIVAGLARGERPSAAQVAGIVAAIAGVALASREPGEHSTAAAQSGLGLALLAALGGGVFFWLMAPASRHGAAWPVFLARAIPAVALIAVLHLRHRPLRPTLDRRTALAVLASALLAFIATAAYAYATQHGRLAVVSVLGSLYPVVTVLLAYRVLGERVHGGRRVGVIAVLAGVVLLSTG